MPNLPNFSQLRGINDLMEEIEVLQSKIADTEKSALVLEKTHTSQLENQRQALLSQEKQRLNLDFIRSQIENLRDQENEQKVTLIKNLNVQIKNYLDGEGFQKYFLDLFHRLSILDKSAKIKIGKEAEILVQKWALDSQKILKSEQADVLRIQLQDKTYNFDLNQLSQDLLQKLIIKHFEVKL